MAAEPYQSISAEYESLHKAGVIGIMPAHLAETARRRIDPHDEAPALVSWCAVLQLRQLARAACRQRFETDAYHLQDRYPTTRIGLELYVPRMCLTLDERRAIFDRLDRESHSKKMHALSLERETQWLLHTGQLEAGPTK